MEKRIIDTLFEASWEVCNKVGGIYTVVTTKLHIMRSYYPDYILIGPYFKDKANIEFEKKKPPKDFQEVFEILAKEGIVCHFGKWLVKDEYDTILIEFGEYAKNKNEIKKILWENFKIDSLNSGWEFDEPVIWATAVGRMIEEVAKKRNDRTLVAHFHEWMAGIALLHLKRCGSKVGTVFTTHATMLGRAMAGNGYDLYGSLDSLDPMKEAYRLNIQDKFLIEKACAENTDIFTTVSEITAIEAEKTLGRKPDVLTLNGIDIKKFPTVEEFSIKHVTCRDKIREFLTFHFFPYYTFDIGDTMIMFISGRYEFKNKGIDIFIRALGALNQKLVEDKIEKTVAVFFWVPGQSFGVKTEILENKNYYHHIKNYVTYNSDKILSKIVYDLVCQKNISKKDLLTKEFLLELKKDLMTFKRKGNPPLATHHIPDESRDPMVRLLLEHGLDNKKEDRVKVIVCPVYLEGNDGLINLQYYDAVAGCHLGVFPSYYEPWGYTPMEATALGVPAITSDLAGFGRFVADKITNTMDDGIFIIKRYKTAEQNQISELSKLLYNFSLRDKRNRAKNKLRAKEISDTADWNILIENYIKAHIMAANKVEEG